MEKLTEWQQKYLKVWYTRIDSIANGDKSYSKIYLGWPESDVLMYYKMMIHNIKRNSNLAVVWGKNGKMNIVKKNSDGEIISCFVRK